jgi:thioesterase domain-containing protein
MPVSTDLLYVLIHSPLVGPTTWKPVARQMQGRGLRVAVPTLIDQPASKRPYWKQHREAVVQTLSDLPENQQIVLVSHSGAGPLLPAIRQALANPVRAYVFVDASVPRNGASRLELMKAEDLDWAQQFQEELERGSRYPTWDHNDLSDVIPDERLRRQVVVEMQPRGLPFFTEPIPVFDGWPDAPCIYIQFSAPYQKAADRAKEDGWLVYELDGGHFHMLVDETAVTDLILKAANMFF